MIRRARDLTASFFGTCAALRPKSEVILEGGMSDSSSHTSSITLSLSERRSSNFCSTST